MVASLLVMVLVTLIAVGLLGLSVVELRRIRSDRYMAEARANARLALVEAVGQLQRELGPDQRISAPSEILGGAVQRHWTGVWSAVRDDGTAHLVRDPGTGSWIDQRETEGWDAAAEARAWLVSGGVDPASGESGRRIDVVGPGSAGDDPFGHVSVPVVPVLSGEGPSGGMAWWTGDLGVRANVATSDRFADRDPNPNTPGEGYYRLLASQQAEPDLMGEGIDLSQRARKSLASAGSVATAAESAGSWTRKHFHDFTVDSLGVLADAKGGGLRRDLTAYFESDGELPSWRGLDGISDETPLFEQAEDSRHRMSGPTFGMLRDWAHPDAPFSGHGVESIPPETDPSAGRGSEALALCNENPVKLTEATRTNLEPILVEATNFIQISTYQIKYTYPPRFQLRHHLYPRVVLWNPYNVRLSFDPAIVMIQGNGRWEMWTENRFYRPDGSSYISSWYAQWLSFEGGRSTDFAVEGGKGLMASAGYTDPYMGSYYFAIPKTEFGPGETLVFSPARAAEYDGLSAYRPGPYNLAANVLSCQVAPDPSRSYYVSASDIDAEGVSFQPVRFWYAPTPYWSNDGQGVRNQGDDTRVVMKRLTGSGPVSFESFDSLPQLAYVSASLQYGAGREPRVAWNDQSKMSIELLDPKWPRPTLAPDVRTREGIRLRWFNEHLSNILNAGALSRSPQFFQEAPLATWNPRASYAVRSPWENLGGSLPSAGSGGGPWFFGVYTRDLYDGAVSWGEQEPVYHNGRYHGNPFGPPQEGRERNVIFELPRRETGVVSLGQLQNAKLSEFVWHPSFAFGNSLVDPRLGTEGMNRTVPPAGSDAEDGLGGFYRRAIGWSSDGERARGPDTWASTGRALLQELPAHDHLCYDLSFEANEALWDGYFVSGGGAHDKEVFANDPLHRPLPNGRLVPVPGEETRLKPEDLTRLQSAAGHLMVDGAFNINSTSVEAWKAVLAATREAGGDEGSRFARVLAPVEGWHQAGASADEDTAWAGARELSDDEIDRLARAIVEEVKRRGPFLSLADFVNRRLANDETGRKGALQAAIDGAGLNESFESWFPLDNSSSLGDYNHPDNIDDATRLEQTLKPPTVAWGAPGFLTQGDLLQVLAPVISARSDSFVVRAYGESTDVDGTIRARVWCEAVVQRLPRPLEPDESGLNPKSTSGKPAFGRRFEVMAFRWLRPEEV